MRKTVALAAVLLIAASAWADLQNVEVGGQLRIRGRFWENTLFFGCPGPAVEVIPPFLLPARPIGPFGTFSRYDWDERGNDLKYFEQKTRLNVTADFTDNVLGFIEFESFDQWGTDFRSDYVTGIDATPFTGNDVEILHSYIEMSELFGGPLTLRIGRQPLKLGKGWLVNDLITACLSMSHDGVRLTYDTDMLTVDTWYSKFEEVGALEEDGDTDFYGVYATYKPLEFADISAYWMMVRDPRSQNDTDASWDIEWLEDLLDLDDYDASYLHTVGTRVFGKVGRLDYDLELAYQFGEADTIGVGFKRGSYGDTDAEFDNWAGDFEVGYTFDMPWQPRLFAGAAYFEGEDNRDLTFLEWLHPFARPEASLSFNRLFSGIGYAWTFDVFQNTSNFYQFRAGVNVKPTEKISATFQVAHQKVDEPFDLPVMVDVGRFRVPVAPRLSFWTEESSDDLGWFTYLWGVYNYTEDAFIRVGWEHLFTGDGFEDGSFTSGHGLQFSGGTDSDDADYYFFDMGLSF